MILLKRRVLSGLIMAVFGFSGISLNAQGDDLIVFTDEPESMGSNINSGYDDTDIRIAPDGKTFYFIRWKSEDNIGGTYDISDIYYSELQDDGTWSKAENMGKPINDISMNTVVGIRPDGNAMLITGRKDNELKTNLYITYRTGNTWGVPEPMAFEGLEEPLNVYGYTVTPDFKTLILCDKTLNSGEYELYVSFRKGDKWSHPKNIGSNINTDRAESWPVLAGDGSTLYFTSSGHYSYGSSDILMSKRLDDTWTNWTDPVNMGQTINSPEYDADFIVDTKGEYAYFSTKKNNSDFDIYRIMLPDEAKPDPVVLVNGKVYDHKTEEPLEVEVVYYDLSTGEELGRAFSNAETGGYKILLPYGKKYSFRAKAEGFASVSENINLTEDNDELSGNSEYQELERNLILVPLKKGNVVRMNNLFFETGKAELNSDSYLELNQVVQMLNDNESIRIEIGGHTDNVGSDNSNLQLSKKRAKVVKDYLLSKGIDASRITARGYGEKKPTAGNDTPEGRQENRRVEFKIL